MEDEERQKKLEAGKAKLAEYRQRKAYADTQKKQKKKKKKKSAEDPEGDSQERVEVCVGGEESSGGGQDGSQEENKDPPSSEFTFTGVLQSGETVKHHQKYTIEPESEVSTTAEDYSSEDEVEPLQQMKKAGTIQAVETELAAKTKVVEELTQELEEIRAAFGTEGVQQLQDFEAALKQRDGIITQLTANLQQAREEKDEIMKEFLELTEQSQMLQIQFQQLQAGETLRNTSHSSTAADLFQARQQLSLYQQQVDELNAELKKHHDSSREQFENIEQLQNKLGETEMSWRKAEEFFIQSINEKDQLIAEQEKVILSQEQSLTRLRLTEESFAQALKEKNQLIFEQTAIIKEHEVSLTLLREEVVHVGRASNQNIMQQSDEKGLIIAEQERVISAHDCSITQLENELERSEKSIHELQQQMAAKETDLRKCLLELESSKSELEECKAKTEKNKLQQEKERMDFETCKAELATSRQKERMSSNEIMQLMGTIEDLQKRVHQGNLSETDTIQKMQEDTVRKLEALRAELDEMYGQQIVQMKHELNLQHAARVEQMTMQHHAELELLKENQLSQISAATAVEIDTINAKIHELQFLLEESQAKHNKTRHELSQVTEEKINLQVKVETLLQDLDSAKEKVEQVSKRVISQESHHIEVHRLQEIIESLKGELALAQEEAQEMEAKHDSEITNYKIKLEMLEREKDAVLDRMAESQEAELERLRTQLLFSHEEELTGLREELQRENFLNTENLLNEAAVKHERGIDELRVGYEEKLHLLEKEKASCVMEREELLHQILELKEDLKIALHSSNADELVQQLLELQVELEELRKRGAKQAQMENEIQQLVKKTEVLESKSREKEKSWENKWREQEEEKGTLIESNNGLKEELVTKNMTIETLEAGNIQIHQQVAELTEEIKKQRTTFSFAEKNFEVNYQELKEEYTCLIEAKAQLEERTLKETLEFEAKIGRLQSQIQELEESSRDAKTEGKYTTELMEKLNVTINEKESLLGGISEATEQLMLTQSRIKELEEQLLRLREENEAVITQNESLGKMLEEKQVIKEEQDVEPGCSTEEHRLQIKSLQEEIKALQSLLQATESERDDIRQALEFQRLALTPSPVAAAPSPGEGPVEGKPSPRKSTAAGSNRRKRRQRSKQERRLATAVSDCREKQKTWEEEDEEEEQAAVEEERATSAAELQMQPQMESQVMSRSQERDGEADSTDGYQGDRDYISKQVRKHGMGHVMEEEETTTDHGECRLQMEAQRISLSQIHAAQLELLQEETEARTHSLELRLQQKSSQGDPAEPKLLQSINISQAVQKECTEIIENFHKIFGEKLLESTEVEGWKPPPSKRKDTTDSTSVLMEARELYRGLQLVRETIEQEHFRLSQLQSLLKDDVNKIIELQTAYDALKSSSEEQISALQVQVASLRSSRIKDVKEQTGTPPACMSEELQRLRAEEQEKQLKLEESHREEVERLRAHYQQQATETEERYLTELLMLQQQLQDVTGTHRTHSSVPETVHKPNEEHSEELQKPGEEERLEEGVALRSPVRSAGLAAQLQALRTTLHRKYVQEVAALKEQHSRELRRLREETELDRKREEKGERAEDLNDIYSPGCSGESSAAAGQNVQGKKQDWERIEEEVAKAIVQMSVQFAQQTELLRLNKSACQKSTSMQTMQSGEHEMEEMENEEPTPRASPSLSFQLEEVERLKKELEERNVVIRMLKEELLKIKSGPEQKRVNGQEEDLQERDSEGLERKQDNEGKVTLHDVSGSTDSGRNILLKANKNLSHVLVEVLKTTAAAEETLGLHMQSLSVSSGATLHMPDHSTGCYESSETTTEDANLWSREMKADESLRMSHQTIESLLLGVGSQLENEDYLMGISCRLQTALEKMLMVITDTTNQLEHARLTQTELMRESFRHNQEINELLQKQEELQERLTEEARAREQLALELHRAEGLIDGYTGERAALEEQLHQKEELQLNLEQELQVTSSRLHELEQERLQMLEERELLSRQQDAMREHAGPRELRLVEAAMVAAPEADLLKETEKLMKEKVEVQRQAEKENADLLKHNKLLEAELEEQVSRVFELEQTQMAERRDLQQQIQALEKQLENNRKFLDEQAVDREHERDFFQQEIQKLEQQLKNQQKQQAGSEHRNQEVDRLTSQLKEKADWCSELLLSSEQLRRELQERDEEIDKLESRIRELEQALLASAGSLEKNQHATITETEQSMLESQLQTEREALERKEKEICNLEEQLEQFREELENKSEEVQQLHMQLEIQRKEISSQQEYLETRDSLLQVMEAKDREITLLNEQITKLQHMETASDNKELDGREEVIKELESQVECLRSEQERLKRNNEEEVDQMSAVIDKLQQELTNIEQKQVSEDDEDTRAESESSTWALNKEEYEEMKQRMDLATEELGTLKTEHSKLLEIYLCLKESTKALAETEQLQSTDAELEDALIQKTAGLVVMQAQVQALEQSASSRLEELGLRVQELEDIVSEKECELRHCRLQLEQTQRHAEDLQQKASELELSLRDKVTETFTIQQQPERSKEFEDRPEHVEPQFMPNVEPHSYDFSDIVIPKMDFSEIGQLRPVSTGKVFHLTQRLQELEVGLSGIQKDQELQKQLLSSSEEEVLEYERRLSVLMDLLRQMKNRTRQRVNLSDDSGHQASGSDEPSSPSEVQQELQEVRAEVLATKEELVSYKDTCGRLQEELQEKNVTIEKLKDQLEKVSLRVDEGRVSELKEELTEAQNEAAATKEELNGCRERLEKLQELLQEREMTIAHLTELCQVKKEQDILNKTELPLEARNDSASTKEELESFRQHNEKLQEDLQLRDLSISKLKEELQEMKEKLDTTKEELDSNRQRNEKLQEELRLHDVSISKLKDELQKMKQKVDTANDELDSKRQHNEKLQEDLQLRDISISKLKDELQEMKENLNTPQEPDSNRQHTEKLQEEVHLRDLSIAELKEELQEMTEKLDTTNEEFESNSQHNEKLQEDLQLRDISIAKLKDELQEMKEKLDTTKEPDSNRQHTEKLQEEVHLRDLSIAKLKEELQEMRGKMDSTKEELDTNRQYSEKLQEDLHLRDISVSKLEEELQKLRENLNTTEEEFSIYKQHQGKLHEDLQVCEGSMAKLEVELQEKRHNLESTGKELSIYKQHNENLQEELHTCTASLSKLREELEEMRLNLDTSQENLKSFRQQNEQLQQDVHIREQSISKLKEELQNVHKELLGAVDFVPPSPSPSPSPSPLPLSSASASSSTAQPKRKGVKQPSGKGSSAKEKPTLSRKTSNQASSKSHSTRPHSRPEQPAVAVTNSFTQTEHVHLCDLCPESKTHTNDEMEEVIAEFQEKIVQMQELHAAEILDMEARHISESDSLRRDTQALEEECKALQAVIDKLRSPEARPGNVASQFNFSAVQTSRQDRPASLFRDDYTSDSSSDYSQRTGFDIPSLQQELRTTPEGARRDPDDPLPDRIKTLLREVHQEGMQVLSLTELPISEGESGNIQGWVKERDHLLTTVESLKGLITHIQIKTSGNEDWRAQLLDAVRRVFLSERSVLKSALYRQLDALDTSDAIIHLNQLEQRLTEQDAQHREAMDSLHIADRASLMSEIHQLRAQLEHVHRGESTGYSLAEKREGGGGGGGGERVVESDRLLMEELKGELSQTKLELETTLKAQHKHLKELDTLRAEVSQKAAEVDALNDRLTEEKKRSRDLQWAMEKERCEAGRNEESKREEFEDLQLTLEEQKGRVAQLTAALEEERQASSRLSEQAEEERLSLGRRLQELQVQLETEQAKALEMSAALGRERELRTGVSLRSGPSSELEEDRAGQEVDGSLLERLQRELDDKHAQVVHLLGQLEGQRLEVVQKEEALTMSRQKLRREQEALQAARAQLGTLEAQISESQEQLGRELEKSKTLEEERERLEEQLDWFREQSGRREDAVSPGESAERTKDWVSQQKSGSSQSPSAAPAACGPWRTVDKILSKLYLISSKVSSLASQPAGSSSAEVEHEDLSWVQSNVDDVITMLQQSPGLPSVPESVSLLAGGSSSTLTQRLLRQNAELTGFVSRLTEEKNDLRNQTLRLEEEIRRYRQAGLGTSDSEREAWAREKVRLEKAFHQAQAQVARLRGEMRSDTLREITGPEADNAALKRIYGKYLRSESFRKALIYQKKYLLLLLGGFQECEQATLSLLTRMGGQPALCSLGPISQRRRGLTRFRSAVRVAIALSRMRFLVKRWHKTTGISSTTSGTVSKNGAGQLSGTDVRDSPYLHPGSLETYRDRGGGVSSGRGRSGRESPRSATSSTHHRFHLAGEHGALTCSHLQSYDPDRALTDYISRLEALQRRLGSVTSGATSYAQLHFGLRR